MAASSAPSPKFLQSKMKRRRRRKVVDEIKFQTLRLLGKLYSIVEHSLVFTHHCWSLLCPLFWLMKFTPITLFSSRSSLSNHQTWAGLGWDKNLMRITDSYWDTFITYHCYCTRPSTITSETLQASATVDIIQQQNNDNIYKISFGCTPLSQSE